MEQICSQSSVCKSSFAICQVTLEARAKRSAEMMRVKRNLGDTNSLGVSKSPEDGEDQVETEPPATVAARY